MHWMEKFYAYPTERTKNKNSEILAQLNKSVSRYLSSVNAKITRFEKTSFKLSVKVLVKIKLQYLKIQRFRKKQNFEFLSEF